MHMWNEPSNEQLSKIPRLYQTERTPLKEKLIYLHFFVGAQIGTLQNLTSDISSSIFEFTLHHYIESVTKRYRRILWTAMNS